MFFICNVKIKFLIQCNLHSDSEAKNGAPAAAEVEEAPIETKVTLKVEEPAEPTELDKYWKAVKENPSDFTGWTYLLQYVEQEVSLPINLSVGGGGAFQLNCLIPCHEYFFHEICLEYHSYVIGKNA